MGSYPNRRRTQFLIAAEKHEQAVRAACTPPKHCFPKVLFIPEPHRDMSVQVRTCRDSGYTVSDFGVPAEHTAFTWGLRVEFVKAIELWGGTALYKGPKGECYDVKFDETQLRDYRRAQGIFEPEPTPTGA
jgi:hypothetical protein